MDSLKVVDFLHTYPVWFRSAIVAWVFLTALVVSGLLLVERAKPSVPATENEPQAPSVTPQPEKALTQRSETVNATTPPKRSTVFSTLEEYLAKRATLEGRFVQLEQFDKSTIGVSVTWTGSVFNASGLSDKDPISLTVDSLEDSSKYFFVSAPDELRTFASSLRKEDKIVVHGKIVSSERRPRIAATSIELM